MKKLKKQSSASRDAETLVLVEEMIADWKLTKKNEFFDEEKLRKFYNKRITVRLIASIVDSVIEIYPADVFTSNTGVMIRHALKLIKRKLLLACNINKKNRRVEKK